MKNQLFNMIEPSENLKSSILKKINIEEKKQALRYMVFDFVVSLASILTAIIFITNIFKDAYQSGLSEYISLLFSDGATLASYWQSYTMSVLESLPIIPITITLVSISIFIWFSNNMLETFKNTRQAFYKVN